MIGFIAHIVVVTNKDGDVWVDITGDDTSSARDNALRAVKDLETKHSKLRWLSACVEEPTFQLHANGTDGTTDVTIKVARMGCGQMDERSYASAEILARLGFGEFDQLLKRIAKPWQIPFRSENVVIFPTA